MHWILDVAYGMLAVSLLSIAIIIYTYVNRFKTGRDVDAKVNCQYTDDEIRKAYDETHNIEQEILFDINEEFDWKLYKNQDKERLRKFFGVYRYSSTESTKERIEELKEMRDEKEITLYRFI